MIADGTTRHIFRYGSGMAALAMTRASAARRGVLLEGISVVWMIAEAALAIGAGIAARSVLLTAFGFDSVIEVLSAGLLFWRLSREASGADIRRLQLTEVRATRLSAVLLVVLCLYVAGTSIAGLVAHVEPDASLLGLAVAAAATVIMPALAVGKRRANRVLQSAALKADVAETTVCAYMAVTVVLGVGLNRLVGWWWAEYVAAAILLFWLGRETMEVVQAARSGRAHACHDE
jgi:divalent metal cation (Fe/Co/Zn/Cd) transporter